MRHSSYINGLINKYVYSHPFISKNKKCKAHQQFLNCHINVCIIYKIVNVSSVSADNITRGQCVKVKRRVGPKSKLWGAPKNLS